MRRMIALIPMYAALISRKGVVLCASKRLTERLPDIVGAPASRLPAEGLAWSVPLATWLRSTSVTEWDGTTTWFGEDVGDGVRLAAMQALSDLAHMTCATDVPDANAAAGYLLSRPADISNLSLTLEALAGLLVRLASRASP